ncbi:MAG: YqaJ viral recombinase family protein [Oscillospiraceae bacterium]|nr:YqaJ viral recombinase family protein [Oscillospiraceae bacterium]
MKTQAIRKAKLKDLSQEAWRRLRRESIGGSDAAVIMGLNPWKSRLELYCDKKGLLEDARENEAIRLGSDLEDYVARRFSEAAGKTVKRSGYMWQHPDHRFMTANIDREIVGENALLECKTTSIMNRHHFAGGDIPLQYYVQCMHYLAVTGCDRAYLAVLVLNRGFYWYVIERDENEIESLIQAETDFWKKHIEADIPPVADGSDGSLNALGRLYPEKSSVTADIRDYCGDVERYIDIGRLIKKLEAEKTGIKGRLASALGESEKGECAAGIVSFLPVARTSVNKDKLKELYPDVYAEVSETKVSRVLKITERKNLK